LVTLIHDYEEVAAFGEGYSETASFSFQKGGIYSPGNLCWTNNAQLF